MRKLPLYQRLLRSEAQICDPLGSSLRSSGRRSRISTGGGGSAGTSSGPAFSTPR